jgi:hypothetical protein
VIADGRRAVADAALALHGYIARQHLCDGVLVGPDSGVRVNYRFGRFVKSYGHRLPWHDDLCYLQAQGYWTLANWRFSELRQMLACADIALACADGIIERQRPDGAWDYPNPEWRGRVATTEGTWAALGLIETYRRTEELRFLDAALRWHEFMERNIGWQSIAGGQAVNSFAGRTDAIVSNTAFTLRLMAELADVTGDEDFLGCCGPMLTFLQAVSRPSGELPSQVKAGGGHTRHEHFQCFQDNAFEAFDLARFEELTGDVRAEQLVCGITRFLRSGVSADGAVRYDCSTSYPQVSYHLAAVSAALGEGARRGVPRAAAPSVATLGHLLGLQEADGSFPHSRRDYGVLSDRRAYPRNLAMILLHLLELDPARLARLTIPSLRAV